MTFGLFACTATKSTDTFTLVATNQASQLIEKLEIGNKYIGDIRAELITTKDNPVMTSKISKLLKTMQTVDSISLNAISFIEQLKIQLLANDNNKITKDSTKILNDIDYKNFKNLESYSPVKSIFQSQNGKELSINIKTLDKILVELPASLLNEHCSFGIYKPNFPSIQKFDSKSELIAKLHERIDPNTYNYKEDRQIVEDIYILLSKSQFHNNTHWLNEYFQNTSLIESLIRLNLLQLDIMDARNLLIMSLNSKMNRCGYGFTEIIALVEGPASAEIGALARIKVGIGAFDEYNNPTIELNSQKEAKIIYEEGFAYITFPAENGVQLISGTVSIKNKSGVEKRIPFEWELLGK